MSEHDFLFFLVFHGNMQWPDTPSNTQVLEFSRLESQERLTQKPHETTGQLWAVPVGILACFFL